MKKISNSNLSTEGLFTKFSHKTLKRPMFYKNYSHSNTLKATDLNTPIFYSTSNPISTEHSLSNTNLFNYKIENEHLYEIIFQLKSQIINLKKEVLTLQRENIDKNQVIRIKDKEINKLINDNANHNDILENEIKNLTQINK